MIKAVVYSDGKLFYENELENISKYIKKKRKHNLA